MLWFKAFHIIALVAWFAGLFYLPRLFVYHADTVDDISLHRFKIMERRLYYGITWPAAILTTIFGVCLLTINYKYYLSMPWMHVKLGLVLILWAYHLGCGHFCKQFATDKNIRSSKYFRYYNEFPTLLLIGIVIMVVVKPFA